MNLKDRLKELNKNEKFQVRTQLLGNDPISGDVTAQAIVTIIENDTDGKPIPVREATMVATANSNRISNAAESACSGAINRCLVMLGYGIDEADLGRKYKEAAIITEEEVNELTNAVENSFRKR